MIGTTVGASVGIGYLALSVMVIHCPIFMCTGAGTVLPVVHRVFFSFAPRRRRKIHYFLDIVYIYF